MHIISAHGQQWQRVERVPSEAVTFNSFFAWLARQNQLHFALDCVKHQCFVVVPQPCNDDDLRIEIDGTNSVLGTLETVHRDARIEYVVEPVTGVDNGHGTVPSPHRATTASLHAASITLAQVQSREQRKACHNSSLPRPYEDQVRLVFGSLIFLNAILVGFEVDSYGEDLDFNPAWYSVECFFTIAFVLELTWRLTLVGRSFLKDLHNFFDCLLIILAFIHTVLLTWVVAYKDRSPVRAMSLLRVCQFLRPTCFARIPRALKEFGVVTPRFVHAVQVVFWFSLPVLAFAYASAVLIVQGTAELRWERSVQKEDLDYRCSTVPRAMLVVLQAVTLDNWADIAQGLSADVPWLAVFVALCTVSGAFVLLPFLFGLLCGNVQRSLMQKEQEQRERKEETAAWKIQRIWQALACADAACSGSVTKDEVESCLLQEYASSCDCLEACDVDRLLGTLRVDGQNKVSIGDVTVALCRHFGLQRPQMERLLMYCELKGIHQQLDSLERTAQRCCEDHAGTHSGAGGSSSKQVLEAKKLRAAVDKATWRWAGQEATSSCGSGNPASGSHSFGGVGHGSQTALRAQRSVVKGERILQQPKLVPGERNDPFLALMADEAPDYFCAELHSAAAPSSGASLKEVPNNFGKRSIAEHV